MENYFDILSQFESVNPEGSGQTLKIFDFDGTIFNSPNPNPAVWDKKEVGKIMSEVHRGGLGWYQNPITLDDKYIVDADFYAPVVEEVRKSMADPKCITVLLTGRSTDYADQIKNIVGRGDLQFDAYGFKPAGGGVTTMDFKQQFIRKLIDLYNPAKVEMWDDRKRHVDRFTKFLDDVGTERSLNEIEFEGISHHVDNPDSHIKSAELERELVERLKESTNVQEYQRTHKRSGRKIKEKKQKPRKPNFWSVTLDGESKGKLINAMRAEMPEGWKIFAHHMTIAFGKPKSQATADYVKDSIGDTVELMAVAVGKSGEAMAVLVETVAPSDNRRKHITVAVPQGGKPFNSNRIAGHEWKSLDIPITLYGKVSEEF